LVTIVESVRAAKKHFFETNKSSRNSTEKTKTLYTFPLLDERIISHLIRAKEREHTHTHMRIPGPAGELHARRAAALREQEQRDDKNLKNIIQNEQHQRRGDEDEEGEGEEDKKEIDHRRLPKNEASTASKNRAKRALWKKLLEYDPASKNKKNKDDDDSLFEQKQYQTIQWLKNGGWRSGRLSKGRFIVEKAKKIKRKSGMRVFGGGGGKGGKGGDQNQTRASSSSSSSSLKVFDGSLLVSDENGDTMTATCDGETLQMLLNHKNDTKKRKTRVGVIVRDVAVLNTSATEQHLVLKRKSLVEIFFQEEEEEEEEKEGIRGKENAGTVAIDLGRVEKAAPHSQVPQPKAVSAFALQAMKLMEKRKAKAAAKAAEGTKSQ